MTKKNKKADASPTEEVAKREENYAKPDRKDGHPWRGTGKGNPKHANVPEERRCGAPRAKDGKPCRQLKILGADVCGTHGGRAPQVRRNAMARIMNNADRLVKGMVDMALDEEQSAPVRIAASRDLLDRGGVRVPDKVDISHEMKPYERVMTRIVRVAPADEELDPAILALQESTEDDRY